MKTITLVPILLGLPLAACVQLSAVPGSVDIPVPHGEHLHAESIYLCGDTQVNHIHEDGVSLLLMGDEEVTLTRLPAASGIKYEGELNGEPLLYWEKGYSAILEVGGKTYPECEKLACVPL